MEWVETTGKTIEEALEAALDELGVDEADAEYEVLEEPKTGLFGRLRSEARIRVRVRPTAPRQKDERRSRGGRKASGATAKAAGTEAAGDGGAARADGAESDAAGEVSSDGPETPLTAPTRDGAPSADPVPGSSSVPRRNSPASAGSGAARGQRPPSARRAAGGSDEGRSQEPDEVEMTDHETAMPLSEQGEVAAAFVRGVVERFGASTADVSFQEIDEETVEVQVAGDELGLLIGPKGATLQALQELTRSAVQRHSAARVGRILVDISGYRQRRREALERFASKVAEDVQSGGQPIVLEPMSPADRKVVHDTINGIDGVATSSEGEEPRRRVVVSPG